VLMLLDPRGHYIDSLAEISDREEILALLEEAD